MLNDKLIIELSVNYIYKIDKLKDKSSHEYKTLMDTFNDIEIIDMQTPFIGSNLNAISIQDTKSKDVAIIYEGSHSLTDWQNDNLNNFLNKSVKAYDVALKYFEYIERKGYRITHLGGNSLGGGCAMYVGINYPHVRALCINASPLSKTTYIDTKNIIHIRDNADPLYRAIALDRDRYKEGYLGNIVIVNRSLFGSHDFANHVELAHRGSILFPTTTLETNYQVDSLEQLKDKVDEKTYQYYALLTKAPTIAEYMSFDLLSGNLLNYEDVPTAFNIDDVQDHFGLRVKEIEKSLTEYIVPLTKLKTQNEFIYFSDSLAIDIKSVIKYSLLQITKQNSQLYDKVFFVIEKSADYIYKIIADKLNKILKEMDTDKFSLDQSKIKQDLAVNEEALTNIVSLLIAINNELFDYERFKFKNLFKVKNGIEFKTMPTPWSINYKTELFDKIDDSIKAGVIKNHNFIEQIEKLIFAAFRNNEIKLRLPFESTTKNDIEYVLERYDLATVIEEGMELFKQDLYEIALTDSSFYNYLVGIKNINEQLDYILITLNNLSNYLKKLEISSNNRKHLDALIENTKRYINDLLYYNNMSIID